MQGHPNHLIDPPLAGLSFLQPVIIRRRLVQTLRMLHMGQARGTVALAQAVLALGDIQHDSRYPQSSGGGAFDLTRPAAPGSSSIRAWFARWRTARDYWGSCQPSTLGAAKSHASGL